MNRFFLSLLSVSLALASPVLAQEPIRIGVCLPLTGNLGYSGLQIWQGIRIANKMCPHVLDRPVELRIVDTRSDRAEAADAVFRLTVKEKVALVIGEAAPFFSCGAESDQAAVAAKLAVHHLGARTAAIICDIAQEDSIRLAVYFKKAFDRAGGRVISELRVKTGDRDFTGQINQIRKAKSEIIYAPICYLECALLARQARDMGLETPIIAGSAAHVPELAELVGKRGEDLFLTICLHERISDTEMGKRFQITRANKIGKEPEDGHYRGAEAYLQILKTIRKCGSIDSEKIREALSCSTRFEGVNGTIADGKDRQTRCRVVVSQVKAGKFVRLGTDELGPPSAHTLVEGQAVQ